MDKKATDKIISVYWFAILFIVAGAIIYMAMLFYAPYDIRDVEANFMVNQVADCLSSGGILEDNWKIVDENNILGICDLTFQVEDSYNWNNNQYYLKIDFMNFNTGGEARSPVSLGNINLRDSCNQKGKLLPVCVEREFYTLDKEGNPYRIKILSIINKVEKNVQ